MHSSYTKQAMATTPSTVLEQQEDDQPMPFSSEKRVGSALHVCPRLCSHLSLRGLACLAASSSGLKHCCCAAASTDAISLLQPAMEAVKAGQQLKKDEQAATWLVGLLHKQGTTTAAATVAQQLTSLPSVPLDWAVQLIAAGVRLSYAQLLAASSSMLAGVEVWVQAQQQLDVQTDIPAALRAVCCGDEWVIGLATVWDMQDVPLAMHATHGMQCH
jgi:hypothetical protein